VIIKAKKSLGQNFLVNENIINIIVESAEIKNKEILEIGPGTGNLTNFILKKKPKKVFCIEKDNKLIDVLKNKFKDEIILINNDILKISENQISENKLTVFGNLPYNISTQILLKWILNLNSNLWFETLVLMFQKEVADRIISKYNTSNYGRLSVISNWKLDIKKIIDVSPDSFKPKPKIDSSVLLFTPKKEYPKLNSSKSLEKVTRIFFNQRRKKIRKSFNQLFKDGNLTAKKLGIDLNLRPQNLNFNDYFKIAKELENL
tara:strand:- start:490 stop:1272 length:783 start_codon:yes stop_codon:yes gene_type:complete